MQKNIFSDNDSNSSNENEESDDFYSWMPIKIEDEQKFIRDKIINKRIEDAQSKRSIELMTRQFNDLFHDKFNTLNSKHHYLDQKVRFMQNRLNNDFSMKPIFINDNDDNDLPTTQTIDKEPYSTYNNNDDEMYETNEKRVRFKSETYEEQENPTLLDQIEHISFQGIKTDESIQGDHIDSKSPFFSFWKDIESQKNTHDEQQNSFELPLIRNDDYVDDVHVMDQEIYYDDEQETEIDDPITVSHKYEVISNKQPKSFLRNEIETETEDDPDKYIERNEYVGNKSLLAKQKKESRYNPYQNQSSESNEQSLIKNKKYRKKRKKSYYNTDPVKRSMDNYNSDTSSLSASVSITVPKSVRFSTRLY